MTLQHVFDEITASKWSRPALPVFLAGIFCLFALKEAGTLEFGLGCMDSGSYLLTGIAMQGVAFNMPLYYTVASFWLNLGGSPALFFLLSYFGTSLLVFCAGALVRGYKAGIVSMAATVLFEKYGRFSYGTEQSFYSFLVMLALVLLLLSRRENTVKSSLLAGLAVGFSILARTPLFLFAPVFVFFSWFCAGGRSRAFALRSLVFLAAAYGLLVPWGVVRYPISGRFSLFDDRRAAPNVIASARFTVFNMEGNYRRVAGISEDDSAIDFFMREVTAKPLLFALTVLRRLWHVFLFYPFLFGLFFIAMLTARDREQRLNFSLPVYFILIHVAFSIEKRYFYPLLYILPPLLAGSFLPRRFESEPAHCVLSERIAMALFWFSFCVVMAVEGLVFAYPYRSARNTLEFLVKRWPNDSAIQDLGCRKLMEKEDYAGFYKCLDVYTEKFDDKIRGYFLRVHAAGSPAEIPQQDPGNIDLLIIRMLREFELGQQPAARLTLNRAYAVYEAHHNMLNGEGYARDKEVLRFMRQDSKTFWETHVYQHLLLWPPEGMQKIIAGIKKESALTKRLLFLEYAVSRKLALAGTAGCAYRENIYSSLVLDSLRPRSDSLRLLPEKAGTQRPFAQAYLRGISVLEPALPPGSRFRECTSEEELFQLLILRDTGADKPALAKALFLARLYKRPLYYAFSALFSMRSGATAALEENLDALERALYSKPKFFLPVVDIRKSKKLSDSAVKKMHLGEHKEAEKLLFKAKRLNPGNPEVLMNLCSLWNMENKKELALVACQSAANAIYSNSSLGTPAYKILASEASFESYRLYSALGRDAEAEKALRLTIKNAPEGWPGLAGARKAFQKAGFK